MRQEVYSKGTEMHNEMKCNKEMWKLGRAPSRFLISAPCSTATKDEVLRRWLVFSRIALAVKPGFHYPS